MAEGVVGTRELASVGEAAAPLERGALMGWFNMGSTVVLLFPKGRVQWLADLGPGVPVRVGQRAHQDTAVRGIDQSRSG